MNPAQCMNGLKTRAVRYLPASDSRKDLKLDELLLGMRSTWTQLGEGLLGGQVDIGYARADWEALNNENTLVSAGAGAFVDYPLSDQVALFVFGGVRYYLDTTNPTRCGDGSTTTSTGSGTCSDHGGILHVNDPIGDGWSVEVAYQDSSPDVAS